MKQDLALSIVNSLQKVLKNPEGSVALHEPCFEGHEWDYVKECLDSGWVSSVGKYVDRFEKGLSEFTGASYVVAVVNGTAALHLALKLLDIKAGDEVLAPALTFIATVNSIAYCGATPHFVDSSEKGLGVDPEKLENYLSEISDIKAGVCFNKKTGRPIRALVVMHTFGHAVDLDPIVEICKKYKIELVEDAAESLGTLYKGKHTGNHGRVSTLSFNGNKVITTGGGGAIVTNDPLLAKHAKHLSTTAKVAHPWQYFHDELGYNYRLPNINAALGCAQLEKLPLFLKAKRALAAEYKKGFSSISEITFIEEPSYSHSNYWLNGILLNEKLTSLRDQILETTHKAGFLTRGTWTLLSKLPMYQSCPRMDLSGAENIERRLINLPSSAKWGAAFV